MKKIIPGLNSSSSEIQQGSQGAGRTSSFAGSQNVLRKNTVGGSNSKLGRSHQTPRRAVRVLDEDGSDVTPLPMYGPGDLQPRPGRFILDEITSHSPSASSVTMCSSSSFMRISQLSILSEKVSLTRKTEDNLLKLDITINPPVPAPCRVPLKRDNVKQHLTEEMLDEVVDICLSATDTISLLDIPSTCFSEDADDAEAIKEENIQYVALCKNRMGNDKYVVQSMQTFNGAPKNKEIQCDKIAMLDAGTTATVWDIHDSFCKQNETSGSEKVSCPESTLNTSEVQEKGGIKSSSSSTISRGSTISTLGETNICGSHLTNEPDPQLIMLSESFQQSLSLMMRNVMANVFQPKLAAYRQLPILEDPDSTVKTGTEDETSCLTPALERLWAFSCELTQGCNITSMAWNKKNPDILAVGYGDYDLRNKKPGLICCWSLKSPLWPERIFPCHSCVTSLDFSATNPSQLAVGMFDGTVALYDVQSQDKVCIASSSECSKKHLLPVWQVTWTKPEIRLSGYKTAEAVVSASADGRIAKWLLSSDGLDCIDLMKLQEVHKPQMGSRKEKKDDYLSTVSPALCVDFHPVESSIYLVGTREGLIQECSISNCHQFQDIYKKHLSYVNHVEWSPFSPDVFLSCSSDWTIQLWRRGHFSPLLSFTSSRRPVNTVRWSPNCSTVFAATDGRQVEIWDLNISILDPAVVCRATPGVEMTALLFATGTDCVLVGDSDGHATVYQVKNLSVGEGKQVHSLEDIIHSVSK